ncbi:hypothetical protein I5T79_10830 [Stenotrophomonas maltophilia]|nr:hypothetical protein [Stenotrophomonas maltophilia]
MSRNLEIAENGDDPLWSSAASIGELQCLIEEATSALSSLGVKTRPNGSLISIFSSVRKISERSTQLTNEKWEVFFEKATEARRIALSILAAANDPNSRHNFAMIARSDMNPKSAVNSDGRNFLWELDLYRKIRMGGGDIKIAEPDLVMVLGKRKLEYSIACKKIYSERSIQGALRDGVNQIRKKGQPGIVALNIDTLAARRSWTFANENELGKSLREFNDVFRERHSQDFKKFEEDGLCDGFLISTATYAKVLNSKLPRNHSSAIMLIPQKNCRSSIDRIFEIQMYLDGLDSLRK